MSPFTLRPIGWVRSPVRELLDDCASAHVRLGIVTTTSRTNVDILLKTHLGEDWESTFAVIVCAQEAPKKKPDPQAYLLALEALKLRPFEAVAMEDSQAGAAAAHAAGAVVRSTNECASERTPRGSRSVSATTTVRG